MFGYEVHCRILFFDRTSNQQNTASFFLGLADCFGICIIRSICNCCVSSRTTCGPATCQRNESRLVHTKEKREKRLFSKCVCVFCVGIRFHGVNISLVLVAPSAILQRVSSTGPVAGGSLLFVAVVLVMKVNNIDRYRRGLISFFYFIS